MEPRRAPLLRQDDTVAHGTSVLLESGLPALPVVDDSGRMVGLFGEREFMTALFPAYLKELKYAGFVPASIDSAIEKRGACRNEPLSKHMNTEHIDVGVDYSAVQLAEIFLHHRVLLVPVCDAEHHVLGVLTRSDFFRELAERFAAS